MFKIGLKLAARRRGAFSNVSLPVELSTQDNYDFVPVMLQLANGNLLCVYAAGADQNFGCVIALQMSSNGGATWTPYGGTVLGGGTNGVSGTVNTNGTSVTWESGNQFHGAWQGQTTTTTITINGVQYTIASVQSATQLTLDTSAGVQTGVAFTAAPVTGLFYSALPTYESCNISATVTSTGRVIIWWENDTGNPYTSAQTLMTYSDNNGLTWAAPYQPFSGTPIPAACPALEIPANACPAFPSGAILTPIQNGNGNANLWYSTNNGVTWTESGTIISGHNEIAITWVGGNTLIGFCRPNGGTTPGTAPMIFLYSVNGGASWSTANTNIDTSIAEPSGSTGLSDYQIISPCIINNNPGSGQVSLLFGERTAWNGIFPSARGALRAITFSPTTAINNPLAFPVGQVIDAGATVGQDDSGYPSICNTTGKGVCIVWYKVKSSATSSAALWFMTASYAPETTTVPTIAALSTNLGVIAGGTAVSIYGTNFRSGASVYFGSNPATSVVVVSSYLITCATPAGSAGTVNVVVNNTDGTTVTDTGAYSYSGYSPAFVAGGASGASSGPVTLNTTGSTLLVAVCAAGNGATPTMSDSVNSNSNAWNYLTAQSSNNNKVLIAYAYAKTGGGALQTGSSHVFTPGGTDASCVVFAFSGTATSSAVLDQSNGANTLLNATPIQPGSITPQVGALVVTGLASNNSSMSGLSVNGSFTGLTDQPSGSTLECVAVAYELGASGSPVNPTWTDTVAITTKYDNCVIASFV